MICRTLCIINAADHDILWYRITSLAELVAERDRFVVVRTDYRFRELTVLLDEEISHLRALVGPVIAVEDLLV